MAKVSFWNLNPGKEYYIETKYLGHKYNKMIFVGLHGPRQFHDFGLSQSVWFKRNDFNYEFDRYDHFYDVEKIKNIAQKARQQMECRALNKILKRVVNETFEW